MLQQNIPQQSTNGKTSTAPNGHLAVCDACGQLQPHHDRCPCGGALIPLAPPAAPTTHQAIDWARRAISCLLWDDPVEVDPQQLESALVILDQMQATLKPLPPTGPALAFDRAFGPARPTRHITARWSELATVAIDALIEFRSAAHRWHAAGRVDRGELFAVVERLEAARLDSWFNYLVCVAIVSEIVEGDVNG